MSYRIYRNGSLLGTTSSTTYTDSGLAASTQYSYAVSAVGTTSGIEGPQSSSVAATTQPAASTVYFQSSFETGDNSQWNGAGSGQGLVSIANTDVAYSGSYYARAAMVNGTSNNNSLYHDYGTPSNLSTQIRNYWAQFAVSIDTVSSWVTTKVAYFQYYDSAAGDPVATGFSNMYRDFQQIIAIDSSGRYFVEIADINNNQFIALGQNTANGTNHGPTVGAWDVLRLQVILDTNGAGVVGAGNGNGTVQLWKNNTLILSYSNVNLVRSSTTQAMGRILITNQTAATWGGGASAMYWDDVRVAASSADLPAMPGNTTNRIPSASLLYDANYSNLNLPNTIVSSNFLTAEELSTKGTLWSSRLLPTGGPSGQPAYQYWELVQREGQDGIGHLFTSVPALGVYFMRLRLRVDAPDAGKTNFLGIGQPSDPPGGEDNSRSRNKWILWPGSDSVRWILNLDGHIQDNDYDPPYTYMAGQWNFEMYQDGGAGGTIRSPPMTAGVWYDIQIEFNATSNIVKMWADNMSYGSPIFTFNGGVGAPNPRNNFLFGGYMNSGLMPTGQYRITHSDLEIGTTFNANW